VPFLNCRLSSEEGSSAEGNGGSGNDGGGTGENISHAGHHLATVAYVNGVSGDRLTGRVPPESGIVGLEITFAVFVLSSSLHLGICLLSHRPVIYWVHGFFRLPILHRDSSALGESSSEISLIVRAELKVCTSGEIEPIKRVSITIGFVSKLLKEFSLRPDSGLETETFILSHERASLDSSVGEKANGTSTFSHDTHAKAFAKAGFDCLSNGDGQFE
jgi:hypothetical protein